MNPFILAFLPILSLMMFVHELGHFLTARLFGVTVLEFGFGLPPRLWGFRRKGVIYSINWIPFGAFVKMLGEEDPTAPGSFASKPRGVRAIILAAGSAMNFLLAVVAFSMVYIVGVPGISPEGAVALAQVAEDSPAQAAGLQPGDVITSFDGQSVGVQAFRDATSTHLGTPVQLDVRRGDQLLTVNLTPRSDPPQGQGAMGIVLANGMLRLSPIDALGQGFIQTTRAIGSTLALPKMLIEGSVAPSEARLTGIVGMAQVTSETANYVADTGLWYPLFFLTGLFSAGLSIANMLPIPALDGGRLFFVLLEWIRGRRIPPEREAAFHVVGIVLLLALMVIITFNDVVSPLPAVNWGGR